MILRQLLFSLCCLSSFFGLGQKTARLIPNEIQIGEQATLTYALILPKNSENYTFDPFDKFIPSVRTITIHGKDSSMTSSFEISGNFSDTTFIANNQLNWQGTYRITTWDTGYFVIPPTVFSTPDSTYELSPVLVRVTAPSVPENQEIEDIREQFSEIPFDFSTWAKNNWSWIGIIALILITLGVYFWLKRNRKMNQNWGESLSLFERTMLAIEALEKEKNWERNQQKIHYSELTYILRSYLGSVYEINLLEKTSYQTTVLLIKKGVSQSNIQSIQAILEQADMVKFAKSIPDEKACIEISQAVKKTISIIEKTISHV